MEFEFTELATVEITKFITQYPLKVISNRCLLTDKNTKHDQNCSERGPHWGLNQGYTQTTENKISSAMNWSVNMNRHSEKSSQALGIAKNRCYYKLPPLRDYDILSTLYH